MMMRDIRSVVLDALQEAIRPLKEEIRTLRTENSRLQKQTDELEKRLTIAELDNDALEQYSRRNSGIPETKEESTDGIVLRLANDLEEELS